MTAKNTRMIRASSATAVRSGIMIKLAFPALVLLGLGTWISLATTLNYFKTFDIANNQDAWSWALDDEGDYVLSYCPGDAICTSYGELESQFMNSFSIGAVLIAGGAAVLMVVYFKRRRLKAKQHVI